MSMHWVDHLLERDPIPVEWIWSIGTALVLMRVPPSPRYRPTYDRLYLVEQTVHRGVLRCVWVMGGRIPRIQEAITMAPFHRIRFLIELSLCFHENNTQCMPLHIM